MAEKMIRAFGLGLLAFLRGARVVTGSLVWASLAFVLSGFATSFLLDWLVYFASGFSIRPDLTDTVIVVAAAAAAYRYRGELHRLKMKKPMAFGAALSITMIFASSTPWPGLMRKTGLDVAAAMGKPAAEARLRISATLGSVRGMPDDAVLGRALKALSRPLEKAPGNALVQAYRAALLQRMGKWKSAASAWKSVYALIPGKRRQESYDRVYIKAMTATMTPLQKFSWQASLRYSIARKSKSVSSFSESMSISGYDITRGLFDGIAQAQRKQFGIGQKRNCRQAAGGYQYAAQSGFLPAIDGLLYLATQCGVKSIYGERELKAARSRNIRSAERALARSPQTLAGAFWGRFTAR